MYTSSGNNKKLTTQLRLIQQRYFETTQSISPPPHPPPHKTVSYTTQISFLIFYHVYWLVHKVVLAKFLPLGGRQPGGAADQSDSVLRWREK